MAHLTHLLLAHLPPSIEIYAALFTSVTNTAFLRQQLLEGNAEFEYAFLDAKSILSMTHLQAAIFRAVNDAQNKRLKSRNVHSEIVFCLSPNNNIATSFQTFGVTDKTTSLIAVKVVFPSSHTASASSATVATTASPQLAPSTPTTGLVSTSITPSIITSPSSPPIPPTSSQPLSSSSLNAHIPTSTISPATSPSSPSTFTQIQAHLAEHVSGTCIPLTSPNIAQQTDLVVVKKAYKLGRLLEMLPTSPSAAPNGPRSAKKRKAGRGETGEKDGAAVAVAPTTTTATGTTLAAGAVGDESEAREREKLQEKARLELEVVVLGMMALRGS